ncbi:MAG: hypothetical protein ACXVDZ_14370 [Bacteroidia bacterium]
MDNFNLFLLSLENGKTDSLSLLNICFIDNPKSTLRKLYRKEILFSKEFLELNFSNSQIPSCYKILFKIIQIQIKAQDDSSAFLKQFSKEQLLQGVANYLEKNNAELKYNSKWSEKYANGNPDYLETERQAFYFSEAGIQFQDILTQFYFNASISNSREVSWDINLAEKFSNLFEVVGLFSELRDIVERHVFFDWSLEMIDSKTIRTLPPLGQKEGTFSTDLINLMKSKVAFEGIDSIAKENLMKGYTDRKPKPKDHWKYIPDKNNEKEMKLFSEAFFIDIHAGLTVERELALYKERYFPGIMDLTELELNDGSKLPLRETFRVLAFLSEFSKTYIKTSDDEYNNAVSSFPLSENAFDIQLKTQIHKGNINSLNDVMKEHYTEDVRLQQQQIIRESKNKISNENCLIQYNYEDLVKLIQWIHQYESNFIRKVIDIFIFDQAPEIDVTRAPFFKLNEKLCWMPNMIAYASFAENLIENLISKDLISIHRLQTKYYEGSLKNIFNSFGYNIIKRDEDKTLRDDNKKEIGDFDLLAYKNGHLLNLQLKLTYARNTYFSRYTWKKDALKKAAKQLRTGLDFIKTNPDHIKKILALNPTDPINKIDSFILSNSNTYDHEFIDGFLKISYFEIISLLMIIEFNWKDDIKNVDSLVKAIQENIFFKNLEEIPMVNQEMYLKIADYFIIRPGVVPKTRYALL